MLLLSFCLILLLGAGARANGGSSGWPWPSWRAPSSSSPSASDPSDEPSSPIVPFTASDPSKDVLTDESREKLGWLLDATKIPSSHSGCWVDAVATLREHCTTMEHGTRQYLALRLTNCQLEEGGRLKLQCPAVEKAVSGQALAEAMVKCLKGLKTDDVAFGTYNRMWIVTEQVCNAVSRTLWEQQAQATIHELEVRGIQTVELLYESKSASATILQRQQEGLALQREAAVLQGEVREGLTAAREETVKLASGLQTGLEELWAQQQKMQVTQELTGEMAEKLLQDVEHARAMHKETHEAVERGFKATRRHLDILSRFRRDVEDFCALLWRGLKPGLLFVLTLRCLPAPLRPAARRLAALTFASSLLWGVFLTGWEMTVDDGPHYFRPEEFVRAHAVLFSLLGLAVLALVILGPPQRRRRAPQYEGEEEEVVVAMQREAEQATRTSGGGGEGSAGRSSRTRRRLPVGQERALRAAVEEVVSRSSSRATSRRGDGCAGAAADAGLDLGNGKGAGGGGAAAAAGGSHSGSGLPSGAVSPAQSVGSGAGTPQGSRRFFSADASQSYGSGTPLRRSPRINSGSHPHRPPPLALGLAPVAEGEE